MLDDEVVGRLARLGEESGEDLIACCDSERPFWRYWTPGKPKSVRVVVKEAGQESPPGCGRVAWLGKELRPAQPA